MAEQIIDLCRDYNVGMTVKFRPPTLNPQTQNSSSLVEEIRLEFKVQLTSNYFRVAQQGSRWAGAATFIGRQSTSRFLFVSYQLPVSIFNHGDKTLEQYLAWQLEMYQDVINIELVADQIIKHWVNKVEQEGNLSAFGRIYPLKITIEFRNYEMIYVEQSGDMNFDNRIMVPTTNDAIEKMLKRVEVEKMIFRDDDENSCGICLEEMVIIKKEEEENNAMIMEMPCVHKFHEECIKKWLKTSHYCPICRYVMPTK